MVSKSLKIDYNNFATYKDISNKIKPFDLIAFRGGDIISDLISIVEKYHLGIGDFSHLGMIVTSDILPYYIINNEKIYLDPKKIYIFESTISYDIPFVDGVTFWTHSVQNFQILLHIKAN
mgnify:FL=1